MSNEKNEQHLEQERVESVIQEINQKEQKIYERLRGTKDTVVELRKEFWEDVTVNLDEPDDVIETEASIKQQAELLSQKEKDHGKLNQELKTLQKLKDSPYFGRIDFTEDGSQTKEVIYIGIASLMDKKEEEFLVYDWRAPISSMYYDYSPGHAEYDTVDGTVSGEISLKRQFIIRQGKLKGMFDTGVTIGDHLLQQALGNNASTTMKNIVATIQEEQNKIIRNEKSNLLVVQGVAGSGKTSAALQRIAYLLYRYRDILNKDNVVLFSPNPLFSSYIRNVLPELGEENIRQSTFLHYLKDQIRGQIEIESPFQQMEYVLTKKKEDDYPIRMQAMQWKSSLEFKTVLDTYLNDLEKEGIRFRNIVFQGRILVSKEEITDYFYSLDPSMSLPNRMENVAKWLLHQLRRIQQEELYEDWVMEQVELLNKEDYLKAYYEDQQRDEDITLEEDILRKEVVKRVFSRIKRQVRNLEFVHVLATYYRLFKDWQPTVSIPAEWEHIATYTAHTLANRTLMWEDATAYAYFQGRLLGENSDRSVRHLFIDEAQDYTAFQFAYIRSVFPYTRMTLLGDINQAIYTYASEENPLLPETVEGTHERITLTKSYRSTRQIVEFTKGFAPNRGMIEAFERDGELPVLFNRNDDLSLIEMLVGQLNELKEKGHETVAIICKTLHESKVLFEQLKTKASIHFLGEETYNLEKGFIILPVNLAKGIEFDAVILPDVSSSTYEEESDRTLFYTACTRAMHELRMITEGEPCIFIQETEKSTYQIIG